MSSSFRSPAFQTNTGSEKWDDIKQVMAYYGVRKENHVVLFDDNERNVASVSGASDAIVNPVHSNGIDESEFREGMMDLLVAGSSGGGGGLCQRPRLPI